MGGKLVGRVFVLSLCVCVSQNAMATLIALHAVENSCGRTKHSGFQQMCFIDLCLEFLNEREICTKCAVQNCFLVKLLLHVCIMNFFNFVAFQMKVILLMISKRMVFKFLHEAGEPVMVN